MSDQPLILTINAGSSSIKFAGFTCSESPRRTLAGQVERIGSADARIVVKREGVADDKPLPISVATHQAAAEAIASFIRQQYGQEAIAAIGHRVVHGGIHLLEHQLITPEVTAELRRTQPLDRSHLPREIALIDAFAASFSGKPQVACFDTAFHRDMPRVSQLLPIPREYMDAGIRRFGFHGLSYTWLMRRLAEIAGVEAADGRIILAHLGAGASMAAVHHGKPIDTTMAFTPTAGLVMATRPGDLDPGLLVYLMRERKMSADDLDEFISHRCGLTGVSQTGGDMRDLLAAQSADLRAADAVDLFCHQARKYLCAMAGSLGGLDTLVFAGGIGEHIPAVRAAICSGLEFMGVQLDASKNAAQCDVISTGESRVVLRMIPTNEEEVMAQEVFRILTKPSSPPES